MALTNTLFSGLSGLDVNQQKLNVVGNNIANVNTVAFKATRVLFKPQFYVTDSGGTQPTGDVGGTNPSQRGLGAVVGALDKNFAPGSIESTGKPTDLAIDGDGFFIVKGSEQRYTRDGSFRLNTNNQLVTSGGEFVQGYAIDENFNVIGGQLTSISVPIGTLTTAQATSTATLKGNLSASGVVAGGASILGTQYLTTVGGGPVTASTQLTDLSDATAPATPIFTVGQTFTLRATKGARTLESADFTVGAASTLQDLMDFYRQTLGINTSIPDDGNPATPTPGVTLETDSGNPNSSRLVITGNLGAENAIQIAVDGFQASGQVRPFTFSETTNAAGIASNPNGESVRATFVVYDSLGTPLTVTVTAVCESKSTSGNTWRFLAETANSTNGNRAIGTGTLTFDSGGKLLVAAGNTISIPRDGTGATSPLNITLDFGNVTSLANTAVGSQKSELALQDENGAPIGRLASFSIGVDGIITGVFSTGITRTLGQLAMATFSNPQGLIDRGGNMYVEGANSGAAVIGTPGTLGAGKIISGSLELSNVDLSEEFINLIIASTGFSASSRVISTSDQLLTELLNTSR